MVPQSYTRKIILETGEEYFGFGFGADVDRVVELVFNTSMVGYQEIISDPSYTDQAVVMTYPLIGNYGMNRDDYETVFPTIGGLIVREYNDFPSNFRSSSTLSDVLECHQIPGICGIDTRKLARSLRNHGSQKALLTNADMPLETGLAILNNTAIPTDSVSRVSCDAPWESPAQNERLRVVAIDCGMKLNIVRSLNKRGCSVIIVPWNTSPQEIEAYAPDGVFISNGPGDPADVPVVIKTIRALRGEIPIFGICLGHQLISLAYGARTYKMKFGHRGGNHPVRNLETGKVEITSQNHSYAVDSNSISSTRLTVTHRNLLDGTIEGVKCEQDRIFSVQYHPESAPGPQDSGYLFDKFVALMEEGQSNA